MIPKQQKGGKVDIAAEVQFDTEIESQNFFEIVKRRLIDVNNWDEACLAPASVFRLINSEGKEIVGNVQEGDFIRINIPGPGTKMGEGYDWVRVETIITNQQENSEVLSITVRPSHHPLHAFSETAHFFKDDASSTFQVKRMGKTVSAEVHGRNELANNDTPSVIDNIRNTLVGWSAKLGMSYPQWKLLVEGLVKR